MINPMNNPVSLIYGEMRRGADALTALDRVSAQYPQMFPRQRVEQAKMILNGKTRDELMAYTQNMAQACGTTLENVIRSIGFQGPINL